MVNIDNNLRIKLQARGICVIIPTYNNDTTIKSVIEDCLCYCSDVIVVNDGSTDNTKAILANIDGIIVVASPQDLVNMVVEKAVNMATMMRIPILALVDNMAYFECPDCGKRHKIYGDSYLSEIAQRHRATKDVDIIEIPIIPEMARLCDEGRIYDYQNVFFAGLIDAIVE